MKHVIVGLAGGTCAVSGALLRLAAYDLAGQFQLQRRPRRYDLGRARAGLHRHQHESGDRWDGGGAGCAHLLAICICT